MESINKTRAFLGKMDNFTDKQEQLFEKKHLKAYLRGWEFFQFGSTRRGKMLTPNMFKVKQQLPEPVE